jgi:hypothetical protein
MARGSVSKTSPGTRLLNFWAPQELIATLDFAVRKTDLDRAKFIRAAIREKAAKHGVCIQEAA